jgi:hypothetical protein
MLVAKIPYRRLSFLAIQLIIPLQVIMLEINTGVPTQLLLEWYFHKEPAAFCTSENMDWAITAMVVVINVTTQMTLQKEATHIRTKRMSGLMTQTIYWPLKMARSNHGRYGRMRFGH